MFLDHKTWVRTALLADTAFSALVPAGQVLSAWPNLFSTLPMVTLMSANQANNVFVDDAPMANDLVLELHVFVAYTSSAQPILQALDAVMVKKMWTLNMSRELPEPQQKVRHWVVTYSRDSVNADAMQ
jgi:hypothetical protein